MSLQEKKNKNKIKNLHGSNPAIRQIQRIKKTCIWIAALQVASKALCENYWFSNDI